MQQYGSGYGYRGWLDQHYQQEIGYRLGADKHYLDYTGVSGFSAAPSVIKTCCCRLFLSVVLAVLA
jgi:hypothetical protein